MRRVIASLDVADGRVVKGVAFVALRDVGDPAALAERYELEGADEIVFLDVSATPEQRGTMLDTVRRTAERLFIPLTLGGGIRSVDDFGRALRAGADKVSVNSAAVQNPGLLTDAAVRLGSQCVVVSVDARREGDGWRVYTHGGRQATALDAVDWASTCARLGAGEILLTSIDRDGGLRGYDLELTGAVAASVSVPVIASGGAGGAQHVIEALHAGADAALLAGILHDGAASVGEIKSALAAAGIPVREVVA
jgi:imidazole glycerol-phosphate synthase subunit HisF